ncbi:hypothetical protein PO587_02870 [Streptomyces gilvifuscus]|uniref:Minor tail protein n=1 Tax=Streptomyces gilvifuscus TaxID=1550617 RepID=A0ABT5FLK0_9ACTN|nr:hypothetical protein [Streptomyces gilvifuscus]MDC2953394.1 hypothetical protein [Streptomyces gilvifuscus]
MTQSSFPFGSSPISTEDAWSSYMRMMQVDGVFATSETGTDLKVTATNASTVSVAAGEAVVQGTYYKNDAALNVSVPTNSGGGSARNDLIVLRRDPSADATTIQYKTGGTSFPSLTQTLNGTWEIPIARVAVAAGASVVPPSGVTDVRWFVGRPAVFGSSAYRRPPVRGQIHVDNGTDLYVGDGTNWNFLGTAENPAAKTYTPVWDTGGTIINWGSGASTGRYKRLAGNIYSIKIQLQPTTNPAGIDGPLRVTLPFPVQGATRELFTVAYTQDSGNDSGLSFVGTGITFPTEAANKITRIRVAMSSSATGSPSYGQVNSANIENNSPFNIRSGDVLTISGIVEAA